MEPYPLTIVTSIWGTKLATSYIRQSLQLLFYIGSSPLYSYLFQKCIVTSTTNFDILVDQHAFYPFDFGLDNWTKKIWIQLEWFISNGTKEFISISFVVTAMIMLVETLFCCNALAFNLSCKVLL